MKDIHNHLLYEIDDGSTSKEKSIELLNKLQERGVTEIVLTPHYIIGTNYNSNNQKKKELMHNLSKFTDIKLYIGNEVFIDNDIILNIKKNNISTINNSRYLLIELPLKEKLDCTLDILFNLRNEGIIPIIAHPERYHYLTINDLIYLVNEGCLLQGNITSLSNKYGKNAKKNLELLLKKHMIHVMGTDTHNNIVDIAYDKLKKLISEEMINEILNTNFDKIINDEKIIPYEIIKTNKLFKEHIR